MGVVVDHCDRRHFPKLAIAVLPDDVIDPPPVQRRRILTTARTERAKVGQGPTVTPSAAVTPNQFLHVAVTLADAGFVPGIGRDFDDASHETSTSVWAELFQVGATIHGDHFQMPPGVRRVRGNEQPGWKYLEKLRFGWTFISTITPKKLDSYPAIF